MFSHAMQRVSKALFPIVRDVRGPEFRACGSAFFVGRDGIFVTCAHLIKQDEIAAYKYIGRLPHRHHPDMDIEILHVDADGDIAVGRVVGLDETPGILRFADKVPTAGKSMCVVGYPSFHDQAGATQPLNPYPQPTFLVDYCDYGPAARRSMLLRDNPFFGMSGGPVVDEKGNILGMQSAVTHPRFNAGKGRVFHVSNGIAVTAEYIQAAITKAGHGRARETA